MIPTFCLVVHFLFIGQLACCMALWNLKSQKTLVLITTTFGGVSEIGSSSQYAAQYTVQYPTQLILPLSVYCPSLHVTFWYYGLDSL